MRYPATWYQIMSFSSTVRMSDTLVVSYLLMLISVDAHVLRPPRAGGLKHSSATRRSAV